MEVIDAKASLDQRRDDIADGMQELVRRAAGQFHIALGVVARVVEAQRLSGGEVRVLDAQIVRARGIVEDHRDRVKLGNVEETARLDEMRRDLRPAGEIGQPAQDTVRGEHDVELLVERRRRVVHVRNDEPGRDLEIRREGARLLDRGLGEVDAGDDGAWWRAQESVSMPKWHCRCSSDLPRTSPTSSTSTGLRWFGGSSESSDKPSTSTRRRKRSRRTWIGVTSSQWARFVFM